MAAPDRVTVVLRAVEGGSLDHVLPFVQLGAHVSAGRGLAVIAGVSQGDLQAELEQQADLHLRAVGVHPLLAVHAREMADLLHLINTKCGGLDAVLAHDADPSEQMWRESREAMESIWPLLDKLAPALGEARQPAFNIDEHVRMAADAKRYRWLRTQPCIGDTAHDLLAGRGLRPLAGEDLDSLIDAQLKKEMPHAPQEQQP